MQFYVETKNDLSDKKGPIDPRNGFPTIHADFLIEASTIDAALKIANQKFPNNVEIVIPY